MISTLCPLRLAPLQTVLLLSLLAGHFGDLAAQEAGGLEIAKVTGKLEAAVGYQMKLKADDNQDYMAVINPQLTNVKYVGTADVKFLQPGLLIRFTAAFDKSGNAEAPLSELEIFTPVRQRRMTPELLQSQTPGIYPADDAQEGPPAAAGFQRYRIVGKLAGMQADKIQVMTGARPLIVKLDPAVSISVTSGDTSFCQPGDEVQVSGLTNPAQANWIQAESLSITGAKPLAPPEKPTRGSRTDRTRRSKAGDTPPTADAPAGADKS